MSDLPIRLVCGRGRSRILTEEDVNELLFGAESDLDDEKTDEEGCIDSISNVSPDPLIDDTIQNIEDAELDRLLAEFDKNVNSQCAQNTVPESNKLENVNLEEENLKNLELENAVNLEQNLENTDVVSELNVDGSPQRKRMKRTRSFVRQKSLVPSTSSYIPPTLENTKKSTRNQKSALVTVNNKCKKSQKSAPKASTKKKPKCLKSASAIKKDRMKSIKWREGRLFYDVPFTKKIEYPENLSSLKTPYEFFRYLFTPSLSQHICEQSILYSIQQDASKPLQISVDELDKFLDALVLHSVTPCKNFRKHWNPNVGNPVIREAITVNRFEKIRQFLHFNDNSQMKDPKDADFDKLFKLRPFIEAIRERFLTISFEEHLSLDEQMCSTKARHHLRQYMPLKPKKHGFKFFVLCGASGFRYDFEMYVGASNVEVEAESDFGATSNVVLRLTKSVPGNVGHKIFFDNFYTALPLLVKLQSRGIYAMGTVRKNKIVNSPLTPNIDKKPRGYMEGYVTKFKNCPLSVVQWKDNKTVVLLSSFLGIEPVTLIERYNRSTKKRENVTSPHVIKHYNRHMGGVDLLDGIMAKCKIILRSKKWYLRIFYHLLDFLITNAWFLYRKFAEKALSVVQFRIELGTALYKKDNLLLLNLDAFLPQPSIIFSGSTPTRNKGRPTTQTKKKKPLAKPLMPVDVRYDGKDHWPVYGPNKRDCKYENCPSREKGNGTGNGTKSKSISRSRWTCMKCQTSLCLTGTQNCFANYHMRQTL